MHQPLHFQRKGIYRFRQSRERQLKDASIFIGALAANEDRRGVPDEQYSVELRDLEISHSLIEVFLAICESENAELMTNFAMLVYKNHVHRIFYHVLGPMVTDEVAQQISSAKLAPLGFLAEQ